MPGRKYNSSEYRYGFNGKEKDQDGEWGSQTHYDYGFRIYNPAIAKFLSVDPLTASYPWYTPYQFAGNMPIRYIDLDGLEPAEPGEKKGDTQDYDGAHWQWDGSDWQRDGGTLPGATVSAGNPKGTQRVAETGNGPIERAIGLRLHKGERDFQINGSLNVNQDFQHSSVWMEGLKDITFNAMRIPEVVLPIAGAEFSVGGFRAIKALFNAANSRALAKALFRGPTVAYYRVQGGTPPNASKTLIRLAGAGEIIFKRNTTINISIGSKAHAKYFQKRRPGSTIFKFEVPRWFDDFVKESSIIQKGSRGHPLSGLAPKVTDPTTPGRSVEFPPIWGEWLQENYIIGSGKIFK